MKIKKFLRNAIVVFIAFAIIFTGSALYMPSGSVYADSTGTVNASGGLRVRSGPGTSYSIIGGLSDGATVTILETTNGWHKIKYGSGTGYVSGGYVKVNSSSSGTVASTDISNYTSASDATFEKSIAAFPNSYKPYLRAMHAQYPKWKFVAQDTGLSWDQVIAKEMNPIYINLVPSTWSPAWKSNAAGAKDSSGNYISFDSGGWHAASKAAIEYYMDPRNFLNVNSAFQFLTNKFDASTQTIAGINAIAGSSFVSKAFPNDGYDTTTAKQYKNYPELIMAAGKQAGANPLTLTSMMIIEQGYSGSSNQISGRVSGYEGYYNYFSVGSYAHSGRSAVTNGLIYAKGQGWNTRAKSIIGGATYFANNYVKAGKSTSYLKKFNVMNGLSQVGTGQYMTAVHGANTEGISLKSGYSSLMNTAITFEIPVYRNMPSSPCPAPGTTSSTTTTVKKNGTIVRLGGSDRYKTSQIAADKLKTLLGVSKFSNIVIASGQSFPDALSGSYLAYIKKAPIILVGKNNVADTASYVKSNFSGSGTIYILGGSGAVPSSMESALSGLKVKRLEGKDRYETNLKVLEECGVTNQEIIVCSGKGFADSLSASSLRRPILLVGDSVRADQRTYLSGLTSKKYYIIGGTASVSYIIATTLGNYGTVERVAGADRYATSVAVAKKFFNAKQTTLVIASGANFPDGLAAGPIAAKLNVPILLVTDNRYTTAKTYAISAGCTTTYTMGGTGTITDNTAYEMMN